MTRKILATLALLGSSASATLAGELAVDSTASDAAGMTVGAKPLPAGGVAFRVWAPRRRSVEVIVEGGPAIGKSPLMAPNADLKDKPEVVKALVAKVRSFAK